MITQQLFLYERVLEEEGQKARTMYVVLNFSDHEAEFEKPEEWDGAAKYPDREYVRSTIGKQNAAAI